VLNMLYELMQTHTYSLCLQVNSHMAFILCLLLISICFNAVLNLKIF